MARLRALRRGRSASDDVTANEQGVYQLCYTASEFSI